MHVEKIVLKGQYELHSYPFSRGLLLAELRSTAAYCCRRKSIWRPITIVYMNLDRERERKNIGGGIWMGYIN